MHVPYRIGLMAYPLFLLLTVRSNGSAAAKLRKAGAISAETARRPETVGVARSLGLVRDGVESGVLRPTGDGRYFVDVPAYRRRRRRQIALLVGGSAVFTLLLVLLIHPW